MRGWAATIERVRARRAARSARVQLECELSTYITPAERLELETILSRYDPADVADIHRIVDRHRSA